MKIVQVGGYFDGDTLHNYPVSVAILQGGISTIQQGWDGFSHEVSLTNFGSDSWLLPGLIDSHQHLSWDPTDQPENIINIARDELIQRTYQHIQLAAQVGITGLRDLGDSKYAVMEVKKHLLQPHDPWVHSAGAPITTIQGHCWYLGGEIESEQDIDHIIASHAQAGASWIKVMVTGGFMTPQADPTQSQFDVNQLKYIVHRAQSFGLPVIAHAHATSGIQASIEAKVDGIEHCSFLDTTRKFNLEMDLVKQLADSGIWCGFTIPTPRAGNSDISFYEKFSHVISLLENGVNVVFSTDAGVTAKNFDALPTNLIYAAKRGVKPLDLIRGTTAKAAQYCKMDHKKGYIKSGYDADYLITQGNPLQDIENIQNLLEVHNSNLSD